jgi:DNA adenine methylase
MVKNNPLIKPYLKWAGGKRQLIKVISAYIPKFNTYYEPFVGAGAVLFSIQPKHAIINDNNEQLMLTYRVIKNDVESLIEALFVHKQNNSEEYFYKIREQDRNIDEFSKQTDVQKAARLIYLNKTCYNGLYRVNSQGLFNVPYGKYKNPDIYNPYVLRTISNYLNGNEIIIQSGDFEASIDTAENGSFVYFDPPYHSPNNTNFTGYQAGGFDETEQERLRDVYTRLSNRGVKCLLSNSDTLFIRELYKDYEIIEVEANRAINSNADGRGKVTELLIKNW